MTLAPRLRSLSLGFRLPPTGGDAGGPAKPAPQRPLAMHFPDFAPRV